MLDYLKSEDGSSAAEYAMILSILGMGLATALFALAPSIGVRFTDAATVLKTNYASHGAA